MIRIFYLILDFSKETLERHYWDSMRCLDLLGGIDHSLYRAEETSFIVLLEVFVQLTIKLTAPLSCNLLGLFTGHSPTKNATGIHKKLILRQQINVSRPVLRTFSRCNCFCFGTLGSLIQS